MIEDTSFIIDILEGDADALAYHEILEKSNRPRKVSAITVLELYEAVPQLDVPEKRQQKILDVLDTRHTVSADGTVMQKAGKISGTLLSRGAEIDREDCIIAATALLTDEPVLTRNSNHFERIDGLDVESY